MNLSVCESGSVRVRESGWVWLAAVCWKVRVVCESHCAGCTIMPKGKKKKNAELHKQSEDSPVQEEGSAAEEDADTDEWMSK